jgi:hypothetical protein
MTTSYQSVLPGATRRTESPPLPCPLVLDLGEVTIGEALDEVQLLERLERALTEGFWFCLDGAHTCDPMESDQGEPTKCNRCGGTRLEWNPPTFHLVETL